MASFMAKKRGAEGVLYWRLPGGEVVTATREEMKAFWGSKPWHDTGPNAEKPRCEFTRLEINSLAEAQPDAVIVACENFLLGVGREFFKSMLRGDR